MCSVAYKVVSNTSGAPAAILQNAFTFSRHVFHFGIWKWQGVQSKISSTKGGFEWRVERIFYSFKVRYRRCPFISACKFNQFQGNLLNNGHGVLLLGNVTLLTYHCFLESDSLLEHLYSSLVNYCSTRWALSRGHSTQRFCLGILIKILQARKYFNKMCIIKSNHI